MSHKALAIAFLVLLVSGFVCYEGYVAFQAVGRYFASGPMFQYPWFQYPG